MRKIMGDTEYIQELRKMKFAYKKKMEQANDERKQGGNSIDILDASLDLAQVMFCVLRHVKICSALALRLSQICNQNSKCLLNCPPGEDVVCPH